MKILSLRQQYKDCLSALKAMPVTPITEYRKVYFQFLVCEAYLIEYRKNHKFKDIA